VEVFKIKICKNYQDQFMKELETNDGQLGALQNWSNFSVFQRLQPRYAECFVTSLGEIYRESWQV
jgi:hypothetical protein